MKVHLSRWVCGEVAANLERCAAEAAAAARAGADWAVFPESFLAGYTRTAEPAAARRLFAGLSADHPATVFFFGSFTEERRNRMTVWRGGAEVARYDKVHLFEPNHERRLWDPGDRYAAVDLGAARVGLINCNDLRFPEQARSLVLKGCCTALVAVAWWPWRRDHVWRTLLRARAVENGVFVLGCCVAASDSPKEPFAGAGNYVFDPDGEPVRTPDDCSYTLEIPRRKPLLVDPREGSVDIARIEEF